MFTAVPIDSNSGTSATTIYRARDFTAAYHTSQDTRVGWRRCYTPRARRSSSEHPVLLGPNFLLVFVERLSGCDTYRIVTSGWFGQSSVVDCHLTPLPYDNFVQ